MFYFGIVLFVVYLIFKFLYVFFPLRRQKQLQNVKKSYDRSFAIIVPAYNEEDVIINAFSH